MQRGDAAAFREVLHALPQEEQMRVMATRMQVQRLVSSQSSEKAGRWWVGRSPTHHLLFSGFLFPIHGL